VRRWPAVALLGLGWLLGLVAVAGPAAAHAELVSADPAAGARLGAAPRHAILRFTEPVTLIDGGIRLLDRTGRALPLKEPRRDAAVVVVPLPPDLADGAYLLAWRVVSADSHPVHGAVPFTVGHAGLPQVSAAEVGGGGEAAGLLLIVLRWVGFVGVVLVVGPLAFVALCWPGGAGDRRMSRYLGYGAAAVAAAAVASVPLQGAYVSGRPLGTAWAPSSVWPVVQSTFGQAAIARVALLAVLGIVVRNAGVAPGRWLRPRMVAAVLATAGMLGTFAMSGHAVGASARGLALLSDTVHLAAMACWLGGLVVLGTRLLPDGTTRELRETLPRWSRTAMTCVALLVVTGGYQAWREIGSWPALTGTPYGRLLLLKLTGFAALVLLGNLGRLWVQRRALATPHTVGGSLGAMTVQISRAEVRRLRRSVAAEVGIGVAVLGVTAALVATTPGRTAFRAQQAPAVPSSTGGQPPAAPSTTAGQAPATSSMTLPGGVRVTVSAHPPVAGAAVVGLRVEKSGGAPLDPLEVRAVAALPERDLAGLPLPLHHAGPGRYATHGTTLPFPGRWQITVTVRTSDVDAGVGTTTVTLR